MFQRCSESLSTFLHQGSNDWNESGRWGRYSFAWSTSWSKRGERWLDGTILRRRPRRVLLLDNRMDLDEPYGHGSVGGILNSFSDSCGLHIEYSVEWSSPRFLKRGKVLSLRVPYCMLSPNRFSRSLDHVACSISAGKLGSLQREIMMPNHPDLKVNQCKSPSISTKKWWWLMK